MINPKFKPKISNLNNGSILIYTIVTIFIFSLVMLALVSYSTTQIRLTRNTVYREQALQIAEAGANYYQWHLAHYITDYWDGNASTTPGPYVHTFKDKDTNQDIGSYSLTITPPAVGSTVATIQSTGWTNEYPSQKRTVTVRYGVPSLAQYAFLTNGDAWIGTDESVSGQFFANGGVRFDGTGNAPIRSAKATYTCGPTFGCSPSQTKSGIWGSAPASTQAYWSFPQPNVDFSSMTSDLATMKSNAQSSGIYLAPSGGLGYLLQFKSAGSGSIDFWKVTSLTTAVNGMDVNGVWHNTSLDYNNKTFLYNLPMPTNGVIYAEDTVWVEGTVKGRAMVAAAKLPYSAGTAPSIIISNSAVYAAKDGTNSLGLIGQQDVLISYNSATNLEIDAAMVAQNGSAQHYYWPGKIKTGITIYGAVASFGTWTWTWVNGSGTCVSGYCNTVTTYDSNLLYSPPPSFPLSASGYQQISWSSN